MKKYLPTTINMNTFSSIALGSLLGTFVLSKILTPEHWVVKGLMTGIAMGSAGFSAPDITTTPYRCFDPSTHHHSTHTRYHRQQVHPPPMKPKKRKVTAAMKRLVAADQHWRCCVCDRLLEASFEVDHHIPLHLGGSNKRDNLRALCRRCHGDKSLQEIEDRYHR